MFWHHLRVIGDIQFVAMQPHTLRDRPLAVDTVARLSKHTDILLDVVLILLLHHFTVLLSLLGVVTWVLSQINGQ